MHVEDYGVTKDTPDEEVWVCPSCGTECHVDRVGEKCPHCGADAADSE